MGVGYGNVMTDDTRSDGRRQQDRRLWGDQTFALCRRGYLWAPDLRGALPAVRTRLLGRPTVVVSGPEGVRRFYDDRLQRRHAVPPLVKLVLFGRGAVHGLDDEAHRQRKSLFVDTLTASSVADLAGRADRQWQVTISGWANRDGVRLFDEATATLAAAALPWAGISIRPDEVQRRTEQLVAVVDGFATPVRPYLRAAMARWHTNRWLCRQVRQARSGRLHSEPGTALHAVATFRDDNGQLLPPRVAGVELHNFIRPTIAVAWFVSFAGKALHEHPHWRDRIASGDDRALHAFTHEVRRLYPFVPILAARARHDQDVAGYRLRRGGLVVLDVHGTNHDPSRWAEPDVFDPDRFLTGSYDPDALVPQGGGDVAHGHRCPGEDVTLTMLRVAVRRLAEQPDLVTSADLTYDTSRIPTRPLAGVPLEPRRNLAGTPTMPPSGRGSPTVRRPG